LRSRASLKLNRACKIDWRTSLSLAIQEDEMKKFLSLAFVSLFVSIGCAAAGGNIAGTIQGPDGTPFKAAFVRAQNVQTKMVTIVLSNAQGKYLVDNLAPGTY